MITFINKFSSLTFTYIFLQWNFKKTLKLEKIKAEKVKIYCETIEGFVNWVILLTSLIRKLTLVEHPNFSLESSL